MIIVNQEKDNIINFNNLERIYVWENNTVRADTIYQNNLLLGIYKTRKRAEEVLQEILNKYRQYNLDNNKAVTIIPKVFEMPKE